MRGRREGQQDLFIIFNLEDRVPMDHPLRKIKRWADGVLAEMSRDFNRAYSHTGRPGVPPEQLLKALLLQALYAIPSESKLVEAIEYNVLYRWFVDLPMEQKAWTQEAFSMNRQRFEAHDLFRKFFDRVVAEAIDQGLVSADHFTVDGTLMRSLASHKSLRPIAETTAKESNEKNDGDGDSNTPSGRDELVDWKGQKRSNQTHRSTTDPEARLARKGLGRESHLCHSGHVLMENRHGLCMNITVDTADGRAEPRNALRMVRHVERRHHLVPETLGADANYHPGWFLVALEEHGTTPHVPIKAKKIRGQSQEAQARRRAKIRMKTLGYRISQRVRKRCEQIIGWGKTVAGLARTKFIGHVRIENSALMCGAAYNLLRMSRLVPS